MKSLLENFCVYCNCSGVNKMSKFLIILLLSWNVHPTKSNDFEDDLKICLGEILSKFFTKNSILVYDARPWTTSPPSRPLLLRLKTIRTDNIIRIISEDQQRGLEINDWRHVASNGTKYNRYKPQTSLFIVTGEQAEEWSTMSVIFQRIKETEYWNRQGNTIIIALKTKSMTNSDLMGTRMLGANWRWNKAVNVTAIVVERDQFSFYTWFPYRQPECSIPYSDPARLPYQIWKNGSFQLDNELFPKKDKRDMEGCQLKVVTDDCYPYTFIDEDRNNEWRGFEMNLFKTIKKHLNFEVERVALPKGETMFDTYSKNKTVIGAIGLLHKQEADLAYSCLTVTEDRYNLAELLPIYFYDSLNWFIPTPDRKSHVSNVFEAFPEDYWMMIFATTVSAMACFLLIMKMDEIVISSEAPSSLKGAILRVFAMALSSPFTMSTKNFLLRFFTFGFAMYSLHITTVYQASLYNLYRSNTFINVYHSLEECTDHNLFVWLRDGSSRNLYGNETDPTWAKVWRPGYHDFISSSKYGIMMKQTAIDKSAIFLFIRTAMVNLIHELYTDSQRQPTIWYLPNQFASYPVTLYLSPGHPMTHIMAETIQTIVAAGLVNYWVSTVVRDEKETTSALVKNVSLKLEHITGAFMFYIALMSLACGIFIIEIVYWFTHGKKVRTSLSVEERNRRRKLVFRAVVDIGRDRITTRLARFRNQT